MEENLKPRRRWFRFSLRTLFVLVALVCVYLGWAMNWIRQREKFLATKGDTGVSYGYHDLDFKDAPFAIRLLGEKGYTTIRAKPGYLWKARELFPEARVYLGSP